jgi:hypothetical protein
MERVALADHVQNFEGVVGDTPYVQYVNFIKRSFFIMQQLLRVSRV